MPVTSAISRRHALIGAAMLAIPQRGEAAPVFTPEQFGARGDGRSNDSGAMAALAAAVTAAGGGDIVFGSGRTYLVGAQRLRSDSPEGYAFPPASLLEIHGCTRPMRIIGRNARLLCAPGLRYGTFSARTGAPTRHPLPYVQGGELATPYRAMIVVRGCRALVEIRDLELDGNAARLILGGQYGDTGWQIPASGLELGENRGAERIINVSAHHHALDGLVIDGADIDRGVRSELRNVQASDNGRQGCSLTGGRAYDFYACGFERNGRGRIASAPQAGFDIEAEQGKRVRDIGFADCRFADNGGAGLVADSGDSADIRVVRGTLVGTVNWSAWPNKPRMTFVDSRFVGAMVHAYGSERPGDACRFTRCDFLDDPRLAPGGRVYRGTNPSGPIADLPHNPNVTFDQCRFLLGHGHVLPWTTNVVRFMDCTLRQASPNPGYPRGTFIGTNTITGKVDLYSAKVLGNLTLNGRPVARTR